MGKEFLGDIPMAIHGSFIMNVPANTGDTDVAFPIIRVPYDIKVVAAYYIPQAAVTGADTNFLTATIRNVGTAGVGTTVVASKAYTSGVDVVALAADALTLSGTAANLLVDAGEVLTYLSDMTGSSVFDDPIKSIQIDYQVL